MHVKKEKILQPIYDKLGASILGPSNPTLEVENPDTLLPPRTDQGILPNLKWSFADSHMRLGEGGWARETTIRELPSSPHMSGVNMRLKAGVVREMHWHKEAEWAFMLKGRARITAIDQNSCTFQDDVTEGDLWYFPPGIPHSIQGLEDDGCEFLLVFNNGDFSEDSTFLLTDWLAHTPKEVLAKNFSVPASTFAHIPQKELYIFQAPLPPPLVKDQIKGRGPVPLSFTHRMLAQDPIRTKSGNVRITDSTLFPISIAIAAALVEIEPGGMREMHWHTNSDEWQFYIAGQARMTVFASESSARTFNYQAGDVGAVPFPMAHYIENMGTTTLKFLEIFRSSHFADISLAKWLAFTPPELVHAHLNIDDSIFAHLPTYATPVVPA